MARSAIGVVRHLKDHPTLKNRNSVEFQTEVDGNGTRWNRGPLPSDQCIANGKRN